MVWNQCKHANLAFDFSPHFWACGDCGISAISTPRPNGAVPISEHQNRVRLVEQLVAKIMESDG